MASIAAIGLTLAALLLLATFPGWHEEFDARTGEAVDIKPFPNRSVCQASIALLGVASFFLLASAVWQHVASATVATIVTPATNGNLTASIGTPATVLAWLSLALSTVGFMGMVTMLLSISILDRLTEDRE